MKLNFKAIPDALKLLGKVVDNNKSTLLVGAGLLGWVGTAILAAKASPKAETAIMAAKKEKYYDIQDDDERARTDVRDVKLTPMETVKATWQYYIPAVGAGVVSSAAIVYGHKIDLDKIVSITASYQLSKGELKKLKDKIVEKDGDKKLKEYQHEIRESEVRKVHGKPIVDTGKGDTLFYEPLTMTPFYSDIWHVEKALIRMVEECTRNDGMCSLDELLDDLGLETTPLTADYGFFRESVSDISCDRIHDLFDYHSFDAENGDARPCIWLDLKDRVSNLRVYEEGGHFRRQPY